MRYVFMFWEDARVKTNSVYGVCELKERELEEIVMKHFEATTGKKCVHAELRAITSSPEVFDAEMPRIEIMNQG